MLWDQFITASNPADLFYSIEYRVEAGSIRKPNRDRNAQNAKDLLTSIGPFYQQVAVSTGISDPWNEIIALYCKSIDVDPAKLMLPSMQPPAPAPGPAQPQGAP